MLVDHVTEVTPTLSLATPLKAIDAADVEADVEEGVRMVSEGGVVFDVDVGVVGAGVGAGVGVVVDVVDVLCVRVIAADCEPSVTPSVAVTTIVFDPIASGKLGMLHAPPPICAVPEICAVAGVPCRPSHVTAMVPLPPEARPPRFTLVAVVLLANAVIVSVSGKGAATGMTGGRGAGGETGVPAAAYNVCTVLTSRGDSPVTNL